VFGGEECYGASDGALSLPIHLPLCIGAIYAGSATRNSNQKCTRQDLEDKMSRNGKQKQEIIHVNYETYITYKMIRIIALYQ
jgi:hypothetical protein